MLKLLKFDNKPAPNSIPPLPSPRENSPIQGGGGGTQQFSNA